MANTSSSIKSVVLRAGECVNLPKDAVITSIVVNGSITPTSDCTLPTPETYKCGYFAILIDNDANTGHSMDETDTYYTSVTVGGNTYVINELVAQGSNPGIATAIGTLNLHITDLPLFEFTGVTQIDLAKRSLIWIFFKTPDSLWDTVELAVTNHGNLQYHRPIEGECDEYPTPE